MSTVEVPDPDWYLDNVLVVAERHGGRVGPVRRRQAAWHTAVANLRDQEQGREWDAAMTLACSQGLVLTTGQARECGLVNAQLRSAVRTRRWSAPRYGVLCPLPPTPFAGASRRETQVAPHGLAIQVRAAAAALVRPETYISHESAAALHGLPLISDVRRPTLSSIEARRVEARDDLLIRTVGCHPLDLGDWYGAPCTAIERTIVDVARNCGVAAALVMADAALADGLTSMTALTSARVRSHFRPGVKAMDRVLELADPLVESPLESLTRLCVADGGLPVPLPQRWVATGKGSYRVDLLYEAERVIIEADGELKYRVDVDRCENPLVVEKRRQEALERAGYKVVRVMWSDVTRMPADVVTRVRDALHGSTRSTPGVR